MKLPKLKHLIPMNGEEFVKKILAGERDFSWIKLEDSFDLNGYGNFHKMQNYLKDKNLKSEPIDITNSSFRYIKAKELYLPYIKGEKVDLTGANFRHAYLYGANFENAKLSKAVFRGTYLRGANLKETNLRKANLKGANLTKANLNKADLKEATFQRANLEETILIGANFVEADFIEAIFKKTIVTPKEKEIIEKVLKKRELFDLRDLEEGLEKNL